MSLVKIATLDASGVNNIEFTNIPQAFTDLMVKVSIRTTRIGGDPYADITLTMNGSTTGYYSREMRALGTVTPSSSLYSNGGNVLLLCGHSSNGSFSANTWGTLDIYFPNYASTSTYKMFGAEYAIPDQSTSPGTLMSGGYLANNAPITSIKFTDGNASTFVTGTTATLYGITSGSGGATVTTA